MNLVILLITYIFAYWSGSLIEDGKYAMAGINIVTTIGLLAMLLRSMPTAVVAFKG